MSDHELISFLYDMIFRDLGAFLKRVISLSPLHEEKNVHATWIESLT
jgi:hypothetical protein